MIKDSEGNEVKVGVRIKWEDFTVGELYGPVTDLYPDEGEGAFVIAEPWPMGDNDPEFVISLEKLTVVDAMYPETKESIRRHRDESIASCIEGLYQDWYDNGPPDKERYVIEYIEDACDLYAKSLVDDPEKFAALQRRAQADRVDGK